MRQSGNLANLITVHLALSQHLLAIGHCSKLKPIILSIIISIKDTDSYRGVELGNVDYSAIMFDEKANAIDTWKRAVQVHVIMSKIILHEIERIIIHKTTSAPGKRLQGKIRLTIYKDRDRDRYVSVKTTTETRTFQLKDFPGYHLDLEERSSLETLGYQVDGSYDDFTVYWDSVSSIRISQLESGALDLENPELGRTFAIDPSLMVEDD